MPYKLNGQDAALSEEPTVVQGRNYVPLEEVVRNLGGTVTFDDATKTATATIGKWAAHVADGKNDVDVSGTRVSLTDAPFINEGKLYVPWYFFRDAFGYKVTMEGQTLVVQL